MSSTVALILHMESVVAFEAIARSMPVWIAETPAHAQIKKSLELMIHPLSVTWFPLREGERLDVAAVRISFSLDDHYNEQVQKEGYKFLLVFGAQYEKSMDAEFKELGFKRFEKTAFGFVAGK